MATIEAPNAETGAGCGRFGVAEVPATAVPAEKVRFEPEFVRTWDIDKVCPTTRNGQVWGCYHPDTGKAYLVGRDWNVYWHEWCHAKFGPAHTKIASNGSNIPSYTYYIAMAEVRRNTGS